MTASDAKTPVRHSRLAALSDLAGLAGVAGALSRTAPLLILAPAWETAARLHPSPALPPLSEVGAAWFDLVWSGELVANGASSLYRAGAGLLLAVAVGGALGIFMASSRG